MMSKENLPSFERPQAAELRRRLQEPRRFLQVVAGPRQVGKSTMVRQVLGERSGPTRIASADEPALKGSDWIAQQWEAARATLREGPGTDGILALDEIQKITGWSESVKRLWDEDGASGLPLKVVILGSAPLLMRQGLTESLAGRFEMLHLPHWSFTEMQAAFGFDLDRFLVFGGYPGSAALVDDPPRWSAYIRDALIETTISRDILLLNRVHKPALLRRLFDLACRYSGRILSYNKMLGQLHDAGNTTTLAHYLDLLHGAGMVMGLEKFSGRVVRSRASSPKLQVLNTALMTARSGDDPLRSLRDPRERGRLVESAVGAHLVNSGMAGTLEVYYWREGNDEVDFVVRRGDQVSAIEVKSGAESGTGQGMEAFKRKFGESRSLLVGGDGIPVEEFLARPVEHWVAG